jgi:hypothetical protein
VLRSAVPVVFSAGIAPHAASVFWAGFEETGDPAVLADEQAVAETSNATAIPRPTSDLLK